MDTVRLDAGSNITAAVKVSITLPSGFSFADGTMGVKEFTTDAKGKLAVPGIKCTSTVGVYSIAAKSGKSGASAEINVKALLSAGSQINLRGTPFDMVLTPNNLFAYIAIFNIGLVVKVDLSTGELLREIDFGGRVWRISISPDGTRIYVPRDEFVDIIDVSEDRVANRIVVPGMSYAMTLDFSSDGLYAFVGSQKVAFSDSSLFRINVKMEALDRTYPLPYGMFYHSLCCIDDKTVYSLDGAAGILYRTNPVSGLTDVVYRRTSSSTLSSTMVQSHDRKYVYLGLVNQRLAVKIDAQTSQPSLISISHGQVNPIAVNATNTMMLVRSDVVGVAGALIDLASGNVVKNVANASTHGAVFSSTGKIVFLCDVAGKRLSVIASS